MEKIVEIKNVSKVIKGRTIVENLSFDVHKGEVFGFLGPNGAGKTTTIRMMVGLMDITEGDITISGASIKTRFEEAIKHVGAIVENPEMYKFLSGYDNLLHYARMTKNVSREKMDEVIEFVGLKERIHDKVKTYSLGMRQRLGLAQCLLHDPDLLILDEPTNGLDPAGIREIRDHLRKLARERGMAVIVSSHLLSEMEMMCDRIGIIQNGRLVDVQLVNEFVEGKDLIYELEATPKERAISILTSHFPEIEMTETEKGLCASLSKEQIPEVVRLLVEGNASVYSVQQVSKTLEDRFLEVTEGKAVVLNV